MGHPPVTDMCGTRSPESDMGQTLVRHRLHMCGAHCRGHLVGDEELGQTDTHLSETGPGNE